MMVQLICSDIRGANAAAERHITKSCANWSSVLVLTGLIRSTQEAKTLPLTDYPHLIYNDLRSAVSDLSGGIL